MSYIIVFSIFFFTWISSFLRRNSEFFVLLLSIVMWIMFIGNDYNADYENYLTVYQLQQQGKNFDTSQIGFVFLMNLGNYLKLDYVLFIVFIATIGMILIYSTVIKYTKKSNFVFALYFLHPFLLDIVQVKHFLSMAIIVFCIRFLLEEKSTSKYKYIIGVSVAASIHFFALFFIPLIFIRRMNGVFFIFAVLIVSFFIYILDRFDIVKILFILITGELRIEEYFARRANLGFFVQYFIQLVVLKIVFYAVSILRRRNESNDFAELVLNINLYLLILFPFYTINVIFERVFRVSLILDYILFSLAFNEMKRKEGFGLTVFGVVFFLFYWNMYKDYSEGVFYSVFENNYIFEYLFH